MKARTVGPVPRICLTREEAAASLGVGLTTFETHIQPELRLVRLGRVRLVPVEELHRWAQETAERVL